MSDQDRDRQDALAHDTGARTVDPGAAPGVSDAGSSGQLLGGGLAGAGTGTSIGPSRGNTGPGTGSDAAERAYGQEPATPLPEMLGVGPERPGGDQGGERPVPTDQRAARVAQAATPQAQRAREAADPGTATPLTSTRGLGDDDIPAETDAE